MPSRPGPIKTILCLIGGTWLAACAPASVPVAQGVNDPFEDGNRRIHEFNRRAVAPLSASGDAARPVLAPFLRGADNLSENLDEPRNVVNSLLQGRIETAGHSSFRFAFNTLVGFGGLLDPATDAGLERRDTDFGETLAVWGVREGAYVELPFLGPSTMRDSLAQVVDILGNPVRPFLNSGQNRALTVVNGAGEVADFSRASGVLSDLYETSADSYAQLRLAYLQNRRFELQRNAERWGRGGGQVEFGDVDPYAQGGAGPDPLPDPFADPFAESGTAGELAEAPGAFIDATVADAPAETPPRAAPATILPPAGITDPYTDPYEALNAP